jgi:peptide/nickel transport system substrate-binding protein
MSTTQKSWRPTLTRRRFLWSAATAAGAAALVACGGGSTGFKFEDASSAREPGKVWEAKNNWKLADETKGAVKGGIYRGYASGDQDGHYDAIVLMSSQTPTSAHIHEMLMAKTAGPGIDPASLDAAQPTGALAESWEFSPDYLRITFTMRQGVKFHNVAPVNGRVMDMDDWRTSQERHFASGVYKAAIGDVLDGIEFPDARHMVWKLKAPFAPIVDYIYHDKSAFPILPKELNANPSLAERTPIGTGFKILDKYQPAIAFEYRKNPDYWGGEPFIDRWHAPIIPEYANRYAQFVNGNIQHFSPTPQDVLQMNRDVPGGVIIANPIPWQQASRYRFGQISPKQQAWNDPRVRVAMRRSIDFPGIGKLLSNQAEFERNGIPVELSICTHLSQNPGYWLNPDKGELGAVSANYLYDPAEAKKLTAAAGFSQPIPVPYPIRLSQGQVEDEVQLVMDSFAASGAFKLEVERVATAAEYNKYRIDGLFDGLLGTTSGSGDYDPDYHIFRDYHTEGIGKGSAFPHAEIDRIGTASRRAVDIEERRGYLKEFQIFMAEWMAAIPGPHYFTQFSFTWPWLHNLNYGEQDSPPSGRPILGGHRHWLDSAMPNRERGAT